MHQHECAKLGALVLDVEAALLVFDDSVAAGNGYISNSNVSVVPSSKLDLVFLAEIDHVNAWRARKLDMN